MKRHKAIVAAVALTALGGVISASLLAQSAPPVVAADVKPIKKSTPAQRAARRLFDGAPPTIGHPNLKIACTACHKEQGIEVPPYGFAPPSPHEHTTGMSAMSRCTQCHVFQTTDTEFKPNSFVGLKQDMRKGKRLNPVAPPVMPHMKLMRENCKACHTGKAAREPIRCKHPQRLNCKQCHVPKVVSDVFQR